MRGRRSGRVLACLVLLGVGPEGLWGATSSAGTAHDGEVPALEPAPLPDANQLVQSMVERERVFEQRMNAYTYDLCSTREDLDDRGDVKKRREECFEIFRAHGRQLRRLVREDGLPLSRERQAKEEKRILRAIEKAARDEQAPGDSGEDDEEGRKTLRISLILDRFDFESLRRETVNGRKAVVVSFRAQPGKRDIENDKFLRVLSGRLWIDEEARAVARAEFETNGKVKFGAGVLGSLSRLDIELDRLPVDDVWLPKRARSTVVGRVLWNGLRQRIVDEYAHYRRFEVETQESLQGPVAP